MRLLLILTMLLGGCQFVEESPPVTQETIQLVCLHGVEYAVWRGGQGAGGMTVLFDRNGKVIHCDE